LSLLAFAALLEAATGKPASSGASSIIRRVAAMSVTKLDPNTCSKKFLRSIAGLLGRAQSIDPPERGLSRIAAIGPVLRRNSRARRA
jgi:hypothetical protein